MAVLPLVIAPDPRLKKKSEPVAAVDNGIRTLMDDMLETMYASSGIGLAAVQVGVHKRVLVMDMSHSALRYAEINDSDPHHVHHEGCGHDPVIPEKGEPIFMANPEIIEASEELNSFDEGCLSFPGEYALVSRPKRVSVRYLDYHGKEQVLEADGLLATCVQHEMDHLDGITFVDYLSRMKRGMIIKRLEKYQRQRKG